MVALHTPTPWYFDKHGYCIRKASTDGKHAGVHGGRNGGPVIAELSEHGSAFPVAVDEANGAFIVRACNAHHELLAAVHALLEIVEAELADDPASDDLPSWQRAVADATAAIAKAEGR